MQLAKIIIDVTKKIVLFLYSKLENQSMKEYQLGL